MSESSALKEYVQRQREDREKLKQRVRRAAALNPDLPIALLQERFNLSKDEVHHMVAGIPREPDLFSDFAHNKKRRSA